MWYSAGKTLGVSLSLLARGDDGGRSSAFSTELGYLAAVGLGKVS